MLTVERYIAELPPEQALLVETLNDLILDAANGIQTKIAYGVPFYYRLGRFCYLNANKKGVHICFTKGIHLSNAHELLERFDRKQIMSITFQTVADLERIGEEVYVIIQEAILLNEIGVKETDR